MSRYSSLIRLHSWKVDKKRRTLADLEKLSQEMRFRLKNLGEEVKQEQEAARQAGASGGNYANYANNARLRRMTMENSIANISEQVVAARDEVAEAYRELKKYETADANQRRQVEQRNIRREQIALDEVALNVFRRRQD